jgi:microcystin degradation protein MlrC
MRSIMHSVHDWERKPGVLSITATAGYPYSDVSRLGMTVTAYATAGQELADHCSREIAAFMWARRKEFTVRNTSTYDAVRQAMAAPEGPVILVDVADNIGGGTLGDGTVLLRELLAQRAPGAVVTLADPESVSAAIAAGVHHEVQIRAGGKSDSFHGDPVPLRGTVRLISDGVYTHRGSYMPGLQVQMGRTAVIASGGVEIVVMERKAMPFDAEQLRCLGIEPAQRRIIVVKSAIAWKAAYGDIAKHVIYVDTPGLCSSDLSTFAYRKRPRPVYPLEPATTYDD